MAASGSKQDHERREEDAHGLLLPPFPWGTPPDSRLPQLVGQSGYSFGSQDLIWLRLNRRLSYDAAGAAVGVSGEQWLRWEQGKDARLFFQYWPAVCQAFGNVLADQDRTAAQAEDNAP